MSTTNGSRRRRVLESQAQAAISIEEARAREARKLYENFVIWDDDWSSADLWQRTRGDYLRTLPSRTHDRRAGANWPLWRTDDDLARLRQKSRVVCTVNSYARGLLRNLTNHVIGKGFTYKVQSKEGTPDADPNKPGQQNVEELIAATQDVVDRFLEKNHWNVTQTCPWDSSPVTASREQEIYRRVQRDGECFIRFFVVDGELIVRYLEPEQIRDPYGVSYSDGWSFGIKHKVMRSEDGAPLNDIETVEAYYAFWIDPTVVSLLKEDDHKGEEIPAAEVLHLKGPETDSTVKRGVPFFSWDVAASLERARVLQRNLSVGASVRSATAEFWKHSVGSQAEVQALANINREYQEERVKGDGTTKVENVEWAYPGMIRRFPAGQEPVWPTGQDSTPAYIQGVQGDLRQACAAGAAPEYWTADASNGTYAGLKEAGAPAVKNGETEQAYYQSAFARVIWQAIKVAVDNTRLPSEALTLLKLQVEGPAVLQRDSLQKAQEDQIYLSARCLSPQTIMMERGRDPEMELANIQQFEDRFAPQGFGLPMPNEQGNLPPGSAPPAMGVPGMQDDRGGALHEQFLKLYHPDHKASPPTTVNLIQGATFESFEDKTWRIERLVESRCDRAGEKAQALLNAAVGLTEKNPGPVAWALARYQKKLKREGEEQSQRAKGLLEAKAREDARAERIAAAILARPLQPRVEVRAVPPPAPKTIKKTIHRDKKGRMIGVTEEPVYDA